MDHHSQRNGDDRTFKHVLQLHREFLFEQNYVDLMNFFDAHRNEYHIHNITFDNLKNINEIIYVCRHPPTNNNHDHNHNCNNCVSELENNLNK